MCPDLGPGEVLVPTRTRFLSPSYPWLACTSKEAELVFPEIFPGQVWCFLLHLTPNPRKPASGMKGRAAWGECGVLKLVVLGQGQHRAYGVLHTCMRLCRSGDSRRRNRKPRSCVSISARHCKSWTAADTSPFLSWSKPLRAWAASDDGARCNASCEWVPAS